MVWILNKEYVSRGYMFLSIYAYIRSVKSVNRKGAHYLVEKSNPSKIGASSFLLHLQFSQFSSSSAGAGLCCACLGFLLSFFAPRQKPSLKSNRWRGAQFRTPAASWRLRLISSPSTPSPTWRSSSRPRWTPAATRRPHHLPTPTSVSSPSSSAPWNTLGRPQKTPPSRITQGRYIQRPCSVQSTCGCGPHK